MAVRAPHLARTVGPGVLAAPPPARPGPAPPQVGAPGAEIPARARRSSCRSEGPNLAMEPVATWTPRKVAAWLRGEWGRGSAGLRGPGPGRAKAKRTCRVCRSVSQSASIYRASSVNPAEIPR